MNKEKLRGKLEEAERSYFKKRNELEEAAELTAHEGKNFVSIMEEIADRVHYTFTKKTENEALELAQAYQMIEQAREEGLIWVKQTQQKIEHHLEETAHDWRKQKLNYEEELLQQQEERKVIDD